MSQGATMEKMSLGSPAGSATGLESRPFGVGPPFARATSQTSMIVLFFSSVPPAKRRRPDGSIARRKTEWPLALNLPTSWPRSPDGSNTAMPPAPSE